MIAAEAARTDRILLSVLRSLARIPEWLQSVLLGLAWLTASTVPILWLSGRVSAVWAWFIATLLVGAVMLLTTLMVCSVVITSPRWRLLEIQQDLADLRRMTGLQFEQFVAELLESRGFEVERRGGATADGGIDMIARQGGRAFVVQCKQWRQWIGRPLVQQLYGVVTSTAGIDGGMFVTTGLYSAEAREFEQRLQRTWPRVRLIDGRELWAAVEDARALAAALPIAE